MSVTITVVRRAALFAAGALAAAALGQRSMHRLWALERLHRLPDDVRDDVLEDEPKDP